MKPASCLQVWLSLARQRALATLIIVLAPAPQVLAARLGGAYYVDDAEIGKPASCEIESWGLFALNRDHIAVFSPACVVNLGGPVELGTNLVNLRSQGKKDSLVSLTAKPVPIPIPSNHVGFGMAFAGAVVYDPLDRTGSGIILNIPITYDFSERFRFNVNLFNNGDPPRPLCHWRRRRFLEFRAALERHLRGLRPDWTWPVEPTFSERNSLQPNEGYRLGCDLRPQPHRRRRQRVTLGLTERIGDL
jgi:hypothetical protein